MLQVAEARLGAGGQLAVLGLVRGRAGHGRDPLRGHRHQHHRRRGAVRRDHPALRALHQVQRGQVPATVSPVEL